MAENETEQTEAERGIAAMLDINWNTNWSTLPTEAEQHVEQAYIHLSRARDITEESDSQ